MGCFPKSPVKGAVGERVGDRKELTLVEKWIEFREWVRRKREKKTKVVPINIQPLKSDRVETASNTPVVEGR